MARGKRLGGKAPRRGGRLTRTQRDLERPSAAPQLLGVLVAGGLILGIVAGFGLAADRQLRGGILEQRAEAVERPDWIPIGELPPYVPSAFLTVVDPGFEDAGAMRTRDERSTTIPRELVRQVHMLGSGLVSDARELAMAPLLEQRATKQELLELYLNRVYLGTVRGYPIYGIHYAAREYLGKDATSLTLGETATLAGLLLQPRIERPEERPGAVGARRNEVLRALLVGGYIDEQQFREATSERLAFQPGLSEPPMSRRVPSAQDSTVIRLPEAYRPVPEPEEEAD